MALSTEQSMVILVDQDSAIQTELAAAIRARHFEVQNFPSTELCLGGINVLPCEFALCVVAEFELEGAGGLQLQQSLRQLDRPTSIIFFTRQAKTRDVVTAMHQGAVTVIEKRDGVIPVVKHLDMAIEIARESFTATQLQRTAINQLNSLNSGEQEVLTGILKGELNKEIAQRLNLSVRTIEQRRRQVFRKLDVQHPASLAKKVLQASPQSSRFFVTDNVGIPAPTAAKAVPPIRRPATCHAD